MNWQKSISCDQGRVARHLYIVAIQNEPISLVMGGSLVSKCGLTLLICFCCLGSTWDQSPKCCKAVFLPLCFSTRASFIIFIFCLLATCLTCWPGGDMLLFLCQGRGELGEFLIYSCRLSNNSCLGASSPVGSHQWLKFCHHLLNTHDLFLELSVQKPS